MERPVTARVPRPRSGGRLRIIVAGMLAGDPHQGGATWALLQYALGLEQLGHDVLVVEPVDALRPECVAYLDAVVAELGVEARLLPAGAPLPRIDGVDLLLNASGALRDEALQSVPVRVYLDLDPAFTQLWHEDGVDVGLGGHTHYVTVGQAVGTAGCAVPTCGVEWLTTLPPVVLDRWAPGEEIVHDAFTTVGNWRSYGSIERDGVHYGQKAHSLRRFPSLPRLVSERFRLALAIHAAEERDLALLAANGWELLDPRAVAGSLRAYRDFVRGSRAELGLAKSGYVVSGCGWFSDRSACYLASGRPVVAQDTGLAAHLPTGEGLLLFTTADEAAAAVAEVSADYPRHRLAARRLAEDLLDSRKVLSRLLDRL